MIAMGKPSRGCFAIAGSELRSVRDGISVVFGVTRDDLGRRTALEWGFKRDTYSLLKMPEQKLSFEQACDWIIKKGI